MALVETYVDPDNSAGTDYTSLSAWEAGEQTNLVTAGDSHKVWCKSSDGTADTTAVDIAGWTTGESNTITIQGMWDADRYTLEVSSGIGINIDTSYTTVKNLKIKHTGAGTSSGDKCIQCGLYRSGVVVDGNFTEGGFFGIDNNAQTVKTVKIINNMCIDAGRAGIDSGESDTFYIYNNVAYHCNHISQSSYGAGIITSTDTTFRNNIAYDNYHQDYRYATGDYNFSGDNKASGTNSLTNQPDPFVDAANGDFSLASDSDAIGAGIGPESDTNVPTTDIDGDTRSGETCDIGADEYVAAVTATLRQFSFRFRNDDGNESAATWNATENTNVSLAPGSKIRVRVGIDADGDPASKDFQLEYRRKPSGGTFGDWGKVT